MGDGNTTTIMREASVRTNMGTIIGIIGATAVAVAATVGTYVSLRADIAAVRQSVEPMQEIKGKVDQLWWEHHTGHASLNQPRNQP